MLAQLVELKGRGPVSLKDISDGERELRLSLECIGRRDLGAFHVANDIFER